LLLFSVVTVKATDADEGEFGHVTYSLAGNFKNAFSIGLEDGTIAVVDLGVLDREATETITLQVSYLRDKTYRKQTTILIR
jgi:hypothetical protein